MPDEQPVISTALETHLDLYSDILPSNPSFLTTSLTMLVGIKRFPLTPGEGRRRADVDPVEDQDGHVEEGE
jgi:hypothetical protein